MNNNNFDSLTREEKLAALAEANAKRASRYETWEGRWAKCDCGKSAPSTHAAAPMLAEKTGEFDSFYCGCRGWE